MASKEINDAKRAEMKNIISTLMERGWTITKLADKMGVSKGTVSSWKNGKSMGYNDQRVTLAGLGRPETAPVEETEAAPALTDEEMEKRLLATLQGKQLNLFKAYLMTYDDFAVDTRDVAEALGITRSQAWELAEEMDGFLISCELIVEQGGMAMSGGGVTREKYPGVPYTWQCWDTYDSIDRCEAIEKWCKWAEVPVPTVSATADEPVEVAQADAEVYEIPAPEAAPKTRMSLRKVNESIKPTGYQLERDDNQETIFYLKPIAAALPQLVDNQVKVKTLGQWTADQWLEVAQARVDAEKVDAPRAAPVDNHPKFLDYTNERGTAVMTDAGVLVVTATDGRVTRWLPCTKCGMVTVLTDAGCPCSK